MPRRVATHPGKITGFNAARGRPATTSTYGKYFLRANSDEKSGFTMPNVTPDVIQQAKDDWLKSGEMPYSLRPTRFQRPSVLTKKKNENISKGFHKPKSHQG